MHKSFSKVLIDQKRRFQSGVIWTSLPTEAGFAGVSKAQLVPWRQCCQVNEGYVHNTLLMRVLLINASLFKLHRLAPHSVWGIALTRTFVQQVLDHHMSQLTSALYSKAQSKARWNVQLLPSMDDDVMQQAKSKSKLEENIEQYLSR